VFSTGGKETARIVSEEENTCRMVSQGKRGREGGRLLSEKRMVRRRQHLPRGRGGKQPKENAWKKGSLFSS